jgi:hypothetical protein
VTNGYDISPNTSKISITNSGDLIIKMLEPSDSGTYTITSTDIPGGSISIELTGTGNNS